MKKQIVLLLGIILAVPVFAQGPDNKGDRKEMNEEKRKEIEAQRVSYITTQLELTTEESQSFWPVYNEYKKAEDTHRKAGAEFKKPMKNTSELSDKEIDGLLKANFKHEREGIIIEETYYEKFKQVLPVKKVAEFYEAERGFKKELLRSLKGKDGQSRKGGPEHQKRERFSAPGN